LNEYVRLTSSLGEDLIQTEFYSNKKVCLKSSSREDLIKIEFYLNEVLAWRTR